MEETSIPKVELVGPTTLARKTRGAQHLPCYLLDTHSVNEDFRGPENILKRLERSSPPNFDSLRFADLGASERRE